MAKTYSATHLYSQYGEYEKQIFSFIMNGTELDKNTDAFDDIKYEVKRRNVSTSLVKILESREVIIMTGPKPLPKAFKVFCAKDLKGPDKKKMKVFIDVTNIVKVDDKTGRYVCKGNDVDIFISYLVSAMHTFIYYADEKRITNNSKIASVGAEAFSLLLTHIIDYVAKIGSMPSVKNKCMYMASLYYLSNILGRDYDSESVKRIAKKVSGLSDREAGIVDIQFNAQSMMNLKFFSESLAEVLHLNKLTIDVIVEKWMTIYGTGTVFALEIFPAFASMITDCYIGSYLNNQKTIEKIIGSSMVEYTKVLLSIGADSV